MRHHQIPLRLGIVRIGRRQTLTDVESLLVDLRAACVSPNWSCTFPRLLYEIDRSRCLSALVRSATARRSRISSDCW